MFNFQTRPKSKQGSQIQPTSNIKNKNHKNIFENIKYACLAAFHKQAYGKETDLHYK
jgi:hypothetical protein